MEKIMPIITKLQERDVCLALTFLFLVLWYFFNTPILVYLAMAILLLGMVWPTVMRPFAVVWFGAAHRIGKLMSIILLTFVWFILVLPVGTARRVMGKDAMHLKWWRKGMSALVVREHIYGKQDLINPY